MRCRICRWEINHHDAACPQTLDDPAAKKRFEQGWQDGWSSKPLAHADDPIYTFGWIAGDVANDWAWNS